MKKNKLLLIILLFSIFIIPNVFSQSLLFHENFDSTDLSTSDIVLVGNNAFPYRCEGNFAYQNYFYSGLLNPFACNRRSGAFDYASIKKSSDTKNFTGSSILLNTQRYNVLSKSGAILYKIKDLEQYNFTFNENFSLSFDGKALTQTYSDADYQEFLYLNFSNSTKEIRTSGIYLRKSPFYVDGFSVNTNQRNCSLDRFQSGINLNTSGWVTHNITFNDLQTTLNHCLPNDRTINNMKLNAVEFSLYVNSGTAQEDIVLLDNIKIYGNENNILIENISEELSNNQLPISNITYVNQKQCLINECNDFLINIISSDFENDTIYYSLDNNIENSERKIIEYNDNFLLLNSKNFDFLSNVYNDGSYCNIEQNSLNSSNHNLVLHYSNFSYSNDYMFGFNPSCIGDNEYIYRLDNAYETLNYRTYFYHDASFKMNVSVYDINFNELFRYRLQINQTPEPDKLYTFYYNGSDMVKFPERNISKGILGHKFLALSNNTILIGYTDTDIDSEALFYFNSFQSPNPLINMQYVGIDVESGNVYQDYFTYFGSIFNPIFSTELPESFLSCELGSNLVRLYITDEPHLNISYNVTTLNFINTDSLYCFEGNLISTDDSDLYAGVNGGDSCNMNMGENPSIIQSILFFLRLPYFMLCLGNLQGIAGLVGIIVVIVALLFLAFKGNLTTFKQYIIYGYLLSTLFMLMNLFPISIFLFETLIMGFSIGTAFINGE